MLEIFELEAVDRDTFRGVGYDLGLPNLFGGHVLAQAVIAATRTTPPDRPIHSCHAYFLRPGNARQPVLYLVDRVRDGGTFTTRYIRAIQDDVTIFEMSASLQTPEPGYDHQDPMPEGIPGPEELQTLLQGDGNRYDRMAARLTEPVPLEILPVPPTSGQAAQATSRYWFRASGTIPEDPAIHHALLAYASDFEMVATTLLPHGVSLSGGRVFAASLDHALWFHRPFRVEEWLLYDIHSPNAFNARGLSWGKVYAHDGRLVASVAQEGLIRKRKVSG